MKQALPEDVHPRELLVLSPQKWWDEKPYLATAHALRKSPRINWEAYLARYDDVRQSGMDPCLHYLKHGIFEGRKLISWHPLRVPKRKPYPLVSILVANYNNALFLKKCIDSLTRQTLQDLEIIVVDDASTDESQSIIKNLANSDDRIKYIFHDNNRGLFAARKTGVLAAHGRYVMFVDSDDFLVSRACEIAATKISLGYDAVRFGLKIINLVNAKAEEQPT